ncbi:uncharacterized protein LOC117901589 [Drosophila subobscura]|uniref:uncharacterized protein LOC117901589 n=1 Tax=Drosophila subobscura TaxID=7241 RepID=UPI00155A717F|nr:uncharacterized protein LOC117901589 [Drosophila subobscura]
MRSQVLGLLLVGLGLGLGLAQNPFENLALGAMNVAANVAEAVQGGAAINRDLNIDNPLMSVHSKTAAGFGDAMRPPSGADSSESESAERRRRRRRRSLQRTKRLRRAPCHWMMSMATETPGEDEVEARKKRARKRAANNAARSRITPKKGGKKKLLRRRRQQPMEGQQQQQQQQQAAGNLGDRIKGMWLSFVDGVTDVVQQVRQKMSSAAGAAGAGGT